MRRRSQSNLIGWGYCLKAAARDFIMTELVTKLDLEAALDRVTLRMNVRFGVMLVAGLGALVAILKF